MCPDLALILVVEKTANAKRGHSREGPKQRHRSPEAFCDTPMAGELMTGFTKLRLSDKGGMEEIVIVR